VGEPTRRKRRRPRLSDEASAHVRELDISVTPADVRALETLQTGLDTAAERGDYDRVEQLDLEFHRTIYRLAGTPKISWLLGATLRYAPREFFAAVPGLAGGFGPRSPRRPHSPAQPRRRGGSDGDAQARHRRWGAARAAPRPADYRPVTQRARATSSTPSIVAHRRLADPQILRDALSTGAPTVVTEPITLGRTLRRRTGDVLARFDRPGTSNGRRRRSTAASSTSGAPPSASATSPTTSSDHCSTPAGFKPRLHRLLR